MNDLNTENGKHIKKVLTDELHLTESGKVSKESEYYEHDWRLELIVIFVSIAAIILGFYMLNIYGVAIGIVIDIILYFLSRKAVVKVREKETATF